MDNKFVVTGLPRSRTAWTGVFLDCEVHPFNTNRVEDVMRIPRFCDPTFLLAWDLIYDERKVVVIKRDLKEAMDSCRKAFGPGIDKIMMQSNYMMNKLLDKVDCLVVDFHDYDGRAVWEYVYDTPFDEDRFNKLSELSIETRLDAAVCDDAVNDVRRII